MSLVDIQGGGCLSAHIECPLLIILSVDAGVEGERTSFFTFHFSYFIFLKFFS